MNKSNTSNLPADWSTAGSGMNLLDIRTRNWSKICMEATAPDLDCLLGAPLPSTSVLVRLVHSGLLRLVKYFVKYCLLVVAGSCLLLLCVSVRFL